jgi:hypothetical protein
MDDRHDMQSGPWRLHHQTIDHRDPDSADTLAISNAESNMKRPLANHRLKCTQRYLSRFRYAVVTCQGANACTIYRHDRR